MKLLANENFPRASVLLLRQWGNDIIAIGEDNFGITDEAIMQIAILEQRMILTFDRNYGELIFKFHYKPEQGVLYLRLSQYSPEEPAFIVRSLLEKTSINTSNSLTVYDGKTIRQRRY